MQRLNNLVQGYQRIFLEAKHPNMHKALIQALKELNLKKAMAAASAASASSQCDNHSDVVQGVQRQIHIGRHDATDCKSTFGAAYEPWSDDMACILQGSCLPGSTRYCRTLSMFKKMELNDIIQATTRDSLPDGKRHYHTYAAMPLWARSQSQQRQGLALFTSVGSPTRYTTDSSQERKDQGHGEPTSVQGQVSQRARLKMAVRDYGSTVVVFHVCISLMSLGGFYVAVSSGIDVQSLLSTLGFSADIIQSKIATGTSTFVMAYAVHKVFAPVRIGITLTCTPFIVRYLRGIGILKAPLPTK